MSGYDIGLYILYGLLYLCIFIWGYFLGQVLKVIVCWVFELYQEKHQTHIHTVGNIIDNKKYCRICNKMLT